VDREQDRQSDYRRHLYIGVAELLYMNGTMSKAEKKFRITTGKIWKLRNAIMELNEELEEGNYEPFTSGHTRILETIHNMNEEIKTLEARYEELLNECAREYCGII